MKTAQASTGKKAIFLEQYIDNETNTTIEAGTTLTVVSWGKDTVQCSTGEYSISVPRDAIKIE